MKSKYKSGRSVFALIVVCLVIFSFAADLFNIQVKNNEYYAAQNNTESKYVVELEAARGEIVDRNGNSLVTNRQGNSIFSGKKEDIATMKSADMLNLQPYATAQNCFDAMIEKYEIEGYDAQTALKIGNIRYELTRLLFSYENPVTIADDVSDETVAMIKEDRETYLGADVRIVAYREYVDSTIAPHILGTVRKINAEEYNERKDDGYKITDQIGESGIEQACESLGALRVSLQSR